MTYPFMVSVDTEEDVWGWRPDAPTTCQNIKELPRLARFFARLGVRPTFFVAYQVLSDPSARAVLQELATEDWVEIGCHLHPWNTPPYDDLVLRTMLHTYPSEVQAAKIASATRLFEDTFQRPPSSFRAGRFGFGADTAACLIEQGYRVDSSVTPFFDWHAMDGGQNYRGAPLEIYRIDPESGVLKNAANGSLIEVPLTCGYTRLTAASWEGVARLLGHRVARAVHLGGIVVLTTGLRQTILSPEPHAARDMLALAKRVLRSGVGHLQLFFHSSSLVPGLTPFTPSTAAVERLYDRIEEVLDKLHLFHDLDFATVTEAAERSFPDAARGPVGDGTPPLGPRSALGTRTGGGEPLGWPEPRGRVASLKYVAQYAYWRLGGYRRFQRVDWASVRRLVFVCGGNICRSPYAEGLARARSLEAVSLGVETRENGAADPAALRVARARGISLDSHRTTPMGSFEPREGDLFVAMEPFQAALITKQRWKVSHQVTLLGLWAGSNGPVIPDPYGGDDRRFARCFSVIERGIDKIERQLEDVSGRLSTGTSPHGAS